MWWWGAHTGLSRRWKKQILWVYWGQVVIGMRGHVGRGGEKGLREGMSGETGRAEGHLKNGMKT